MRVLYVTSNAHLRSTTSSLNAILKELRPRGLEPVILFRERGPWQQRLANEGVPCYFDSLKVPDKRKPIATLAATWRLARIVWRERIEMIHCNEQDHYPVMRIVARLTRRPIVATLHSRINAAWGHWAFGPPFEPACLEFLSRAQLEATRPALPPDIGEHKLRLLMSGLAIDEFLADTRGVDRDTIRGQWGASEQTVVLGTASSIKAHKRLDDFVELIARLRRRALPVMGVIAGGAPFVDPAYEVRLRAHIEREGLREHCLLIGNVDPILPFFRGIDVMVNTSEMEILSMSLCESMACGRPAIAYAVGGNPETVHDSWCVVPLGDIDALEDRAARLALDEEYRRREGVRAERHVREHFDAPALGERQAVIYNEVLGRTAIRPR